MNSDQILEKIKEDPSINKMLDKVTLDNNKEYYIIGDTSEKIISERFIDFVISVDTSESYMSFIVYDIGKSGLSSHDLNDIYISGYIKYDACSHFYFGGDSDDVDIGYLHICGEPIYHNHRVLMFLLYEIACIEMGTEFIDETYNDISIELLQNEVDLLNAKIERLKMAG